jgi:DNA-binding HxlR family transcriptional regulator
MVKDKAADRRSHCPISVALEIFGDRWSLLLIRDMLLLGKSTYGEFLQSGEGIATNILADRLQRFEALKIIESRDDPENRRRTIYKLTSKGRDLAPVLVEIILWSAKHEPPPVCPDTAEVRKRLASFTKRAKTDRDGLIQEIRNRF